MIQTTTIFRSGFLVMVVLAAGAVLLSGCGGGGGGGAGPNVQANIPVEGVVEDNLGVPQSGDTVVFDFQPQVKGTTNNAGQFTIPVPTNIITANDTLTVSDANGVALGQLVVNTAGLTGSPRNVGTIFVGPPGAPGI